MRRFLICFAALLVAAFCAPASAAVLTFTEHVNTTATVTFDQVGQAGAQEIVFDAIVPESIFLPPPTLAPIFKIESSTLPAGTQIAIANPTISQVVIPWLAGANNNPSLGFSTLGETHVFLWILPQSITEPFEGGTATFSLTYVTAVSTPEPSTWVMLLIGLASVGALARGRNHWSVPTKACLPFTP